ncbi:helix-turn-helix domain-containing protein [Yoonia sp. MH D7]
MRDLRLTNGFPADLQLILQEIGSDIASARRVRRLTQIELAQRMCVSRRIVGKMEKGDPSVSLRAYVAAAWVMELEYSFAEMFAPERDPGFLRRVRIELPKRVRHRVF